MLHVISLTFIMSAKLPSSHPMQNAARPAMQMMYSISLSASFCPWKSMLGNALAAQNQASPSFLSFFYISSKPLRQDVDEARVFI